MSSKVKIATAPCSWGVWYADGTPSGTASDVFLQQAQAAGYKALELGPDGYLPTDAAELREVLKKHELELCAGTACYRFDEYENFEGFRPRVEALCKRLAEFDVKYLVTMDESDVGRFSEKKADYTPQVWDKYFGMFRRLGEYTKAEFGIETVFHPHIRSLVETEDEIERMMEATGLALCFDVGHHAYVNGNGKKGDTSAQDFMRKHKDKIAYLHFKNVDEKVFAKVKAEGLDSDAAFDLDVMCDLADGIVDYVDLKKVVDEIGFEGIGVIEQDMPKATTQQAFDAAKRNLAYLRSIGMID